MRWDYDSQVESQEEDDDEKKCWIKTVIVMINDENDLMTVATVIIALYDNWCVCSRACSDPILKTKR